MNEFKIAIGSDHAGFGLKSYIKGYLESGGYEVIDVGTNSDASVDYPIFAKAVAKKILDKECGLGILVCGSGQGMAMTANRFKGIRAAVCNDTFSAHASRTHNNANILCLGERVVGKGLALDICKAWFNAAFEGGRHQARTEMIELQS